MTQFADDTTLFLDVSTNSLLAALNTIKIFGTLSGLKINTSKTKLVWIGSKKHSREKINVPYNLEWGIHQFRLLIIHFSTNLDEMPMLNYSAALKQCDKHLMGWKKRNLTPFGKITIIKTFILSKFNHIFTCLPSLSAHFNKSFTQKDYKNGGLRMVNIENFIHARALHWKPRIFKFLDSPRTNVLRFLLNFYKSNFCLPLFYSYSRIYLLLENIVNFCTGSFSFYFHLCIRSSE